MQRGQTFRHVLHEIAGQRQSFQGSQLAQSWTGIGDAVAGQVQDLQLVQVRQVVHFFDGVAG